MGELVLLTADFMPPAAFPCGPEDFLATASVKFPYEFLIKRRSGGLIILSLLGMVVFGSLAVNEGLNSIAEAFVAVTVVTAVGIFLGTAPSLLNRRQETAMRAFEKMDPILMSKLEA